MAAYSITFNPLQVIDIEAFETVIEAISIDSVRVLEFQYIVKSNLSLDGIVATLSTHLAKGSPMLVCLLDTRMHCSRHLDSFVADRVTQVLS